MFLTLWAPFDLMGPDEMEELTTNKEQKVATYKETSN